MIRFLTPDARPASNDPVRVSVSAVLAGKLGPALYHHLAESGRLSEISPAEQHSLKEVYTRNALQNVILEHELQRILAAFDRERIPVMPFKGAVCLIEALYPSKALRIMTDLDLLVSEENQAAAIACLSACGYQPRQERGTVLPEAEYPMVRDGVLVDLHWRLTRTPISSETQRILKRAAPAPGFAGAICLPSYLDQFYIRFLHDTIQDHHLHAIRLWQAYEAALLYRRLENGGDTGALCAQAAEDGLSHVLAVYLAQVHRLFPCITRPSPALEPLLDRGVAEIGRLDLLGGWPRGLHFAVGRDLLLRLRAPFLGGYRRAFIQIMWRECTLAEPTDVVCRNPASRAGHFLRLCLLHAAQALWQQFRQARNRIPSMRGESSPWTWLHTHRSQ